MGAHEGVGLFRGIAPPHGVLYARPEFFLDPIPRDQDFHAAEAQVTFVELAPGVRSLE
jgi:hypothetical protein